ncbi:MAG TPA: hypothetical protein VN310_11050 [Candidatus Dormibacteraeota bacterium]|nr:hypothetical protein [Candidatus Dormibacteraeota bacterium]
MRDGSSLQLVREMFANNPAMQVVQDPDGKIRMNESGVPAELLQVKIRHISFEENGVPLQYAAFSANTALLHAILRSPEIVTFMKSQGMVLPFGEGGTGGSTPHPISAPHIVGSMDDLTLSEALDRVLRTFPGVWVYENCPRADERGRFVFLRFFDLQHPGLVEEE